MPETAGKEGGACLLPCQLNATVCSEDFFFNNLFESVFTCLLHSDYCWSLLTVKYSLTPSLIFLFLNFSLHIMYCYNYVFALRMQNQLSNIIKHTENVDSVLTLR